MRKSERGMVTVEIAAASILVAGLVAFVGWLLITLMVVDQCQLTADQAARQAARGDDAGLARVIAGAPRDAQVDVARGGGATTVTVRLRPVLMGMTVGGFESKATVLDEARP